MVDHTDVRLGSPSISFFFARLGVFLEYSGGRHPQVGLFVSQEHAFRPVLLELYPLISHSLIQYHLVSKMVEERFVGSEVRLSELGIGSSSRNNLMGIEEDVMTSNHLLLLLLSLSKL